MKGYFGIGVEGVSKPANVGALMRTAHAFGASFAFTIAPATDIKGFRAADTSEAAKNVPLYTYDNLDALDLPNGCDLVGIELMDESIDLPSFRHPRQAAYVLGPERGGLSPELVARCAHIVRIPTRFSINLSLAGALVMYDRLLTLGRHAPRPVRPGGPTEALPPHVHGAPAFKRPRA
ncbi:RNA methyltransferase [Inquilinus sp. CAU 1745]|uniref:RNA methyltransferase n=1 Tax=Inquilinus sp. CAU 1745 TaxID=3140369 RepID=UPI00325AD445